MVEIRKVVVMGSITTGGRIPKGFKDYVHFATLADAKEYRREVVESLSKLKPVHRK